MRTRVWLTGLFTLLRVDSSQLLDDSTEHDRDSAHVDAEDNITVSIFIGGIVTFLLFREQILT